MNIEDAKLGMKVRVDISRSIDLQVTFPKGYGYIVGIYRDVYNPETHRCDANAIHVVPMFSVYKKKTGFIMNITNHVPYVFGDRNIYVFGHSYKPKTFQMHYPLDRLSIDEHDTAIKPLKNKKKVLPVKRHQKYCLDI